MQTFTQIYGLILALLAALTFFVIVHYLIVKKTCRSFVAARSDMHEAREYSPEYFKLLRKCYNYKAKIRSSYATVSVLSVLASLMWIWYLMLPVKGTWATENIHNVLIVIVLLFHARCTFIFENQPNID